MADFPAFSPAISIHQHHLIIPNSRLQAVAAGSMAPLFLTFDTQSQIVNQENSPTAGDARPSQTMRLFSILLVVCKSIGIELCYRGPK
jgi:hypothetical protein